jgi:hypothetical protein
VTRCLLVVAVQVTVLVAAAVLLLQVGRRILGLDTAPGFTWQRLTMLIAAAILLAIALGLRRRGWVCRAAVWYASTSSRRPWAHLIVLDGFNDVTIPFTYGVRPRDPYNQAVTYRADDSLAFDALRRLARHSVIAYAVVNILTSPARYPELATDDSLRARFMRSTAFVYADNVSHMMLSCKHASVPCAVALQPLLPATRTRLGMDESNWIYRLFVEGYWQMGERVRDSSGETLYDATAAFGEVETLPEFLDEVHLNDRGQKRLADFMQPLIIQPLRESNDTLE